MKFFRVILAALYLAATGPAQAIQPAQWTDFTPAIVHEVNPAPRAWTPAIEKAETEKKDREVQLAILFSGSAAAPPPASLLATMILVNTSTSAQPANFVTDIFGHPFKKGDIPNGCTTGAPKFELLNGTAVPFSEGTFPICWSDASLKWAPFMNRVPAGIAGGWNVSSGTYNSGTGSIVLTVSGTPGLLTGDKVNFDLVTGTGEYERIGGTYLVTSNSSGSTVTLTGPAGRGASTITGGFLANTLTINVKSGGTYPSASGLSNSDLLSGSSDPNIAVTGLDNLTGVWTSSLATGITDARTDNYTYMDGDAGFVKRIRADFRDSGLTAHCQLTNYWYVQALKNSVGGLYGTRVFGTPVQPWYNAACEGVTPKRYRSFSAWTLNNGASPIRDFFSSHFGSGAAKTFTWTSGDTFSSTANGFDQSFALRLTTTGSLPTGLSTGTTYFANNIHTNDFKIATDSKGTANVTPTGACSGTCTATQYPYLTAFGRLLTAGSTGKSDYIQAGGSVAADHTTRIVFDPYYWRSTKMVPPFNLETYSPKVTASYTNYPMTYGPIDTILGGTGARPDIGILTAWGAKHFFRQDGASTATNRIIGFVGSAFAMNMRNASTYTIPVVNEVSYAGMPASNIDFQWKASTGATNGFTNPLDTDVLQRAFGATTFDHMPELTYYAQLVFGEPYYNDMNVDFTNMAITGRYTATGQTALVNSNTASIAGIGSGGAGQRDTTVSGTAYRGINLCTESGQRCQGWNARQYGAGAAIAGGYEPAGANTRAYFLSNVTKTYQANVAYLALLPAFAQASGFWLESSGNTWNAWMAAFNMLGTSFSAATNELTDGLTFASHLAKGPTFIENNFSTWAIAFYTSIGRYGPNGVSFNSENGKYLDSALMWGIGGYGSGQFPVAWVNGTATYTMSSPGPSGYTPANNDRVLAMQAGGTYPTALTPYTPYYMCSVSGMTFQLTTATGCGGSTITNLETNSSSDLSVGPVGHPSTGAADDGTMIDVSAALNYAKAAGATVDATTLSNVTSRAITSAGSAYNDDRAAYALCTSYTSC